MDKKIIIVGAGVSGIAAATTLLSNGFKNVTILEAENRLGGRINTIPFGKNIVELGAQWIHGQQYNIIFQMANSKKLLEIGDEVFERSEFIRSNGECVSKELTNRLNGLGFEIYSGDSYQEERENYRGSIGNFFAEKYKEAIVESDLFDELSPKLAREYFEYFNKILNSIDGSNSWYETSTNLHEYEDCAGEQSLCFKGNGFVTIFDLLQNKIPGENGTEEVVDVIPLIQFNKTVSKITYNQPDQAIKVECGDGSSYSADHLICTISLGVLKERHWSIFEPMLPLDKINSIEGMMFGTVDKIFLEFDRPFWNKNWNGFSCLWRIEELKTAGDDSVNGEWLHGISGFFPFSHHQPNVLCGWICGEEAQKMEQKSDADVKAGAEKILRMFLNKWSIPNAKAIVRSTWNSNPHFRGSYSHYSLKSEAMEASPLKLAEPIIDTNGTPVILFAGEATSVTHYACVHGAIESGWREAERIHNFYL